MKTLVTGAHGFLGSHLIEHLSHLGWETLGWTRPLSELRLLEEKFDSVIHCAGRTTPAMGGPVDPKNIFESNVTGTEFVLQSPATRDAAFLFCSTAAVYEPSPVPISEAAPVHPRSDYAVSKLEAERLIERYRGVDLPTVILRIFNVYGPRQSDSFLIPYLLSCARLDRPMEILSPESIRDFLSIWDFLILVEQILSHIQESKFEIYNVGSGQPIRVIDLARLISKTSNKSVKISGPTGVKTPASTWVADIAKIKARYSWQPSVDIEQGLSRTDPTFFGHLT